MSADAKVWSEDSGWHWYAVHDGECIYENHTDGLPLPELLRQVEECMDCELSWEIRQYKDDEFGLVGYQAR